MSFNDIAIFTVKINDYRIHFQSMNKRKALNKMENSGLSEKSEQI